MRFTLVLSVFDGFQGNKGGEDHISLYYTSISSWGDWASMLIWNVWDAAECSEFVVGLSDFVRGFLFQKVCSFVKTARFYAFLERDSPIQAFVAICVVLMAK
jgi:hypothetical protein